MEKLPDHVLKMLEVYLKEQKEYVKHMNNNIIESQKYIDAIEKNIEEINEIYLHGMDRPGKPNLKLIK